MKEIQKGVTIVESLLYMAIFAILLTVLSQVFFASLDAQLESKSTSSVDQDGMYILSRLSYDINQAVTILSPSSFGQSAATLSLQTTSDTYSYSVDNNKNLVLTNIQGTNVLNTPDTSLSNVSFTRIGTPTGKSTIQIQFTLNSTTQDRSGSEKRIFTTTVGLR